MNAEPQFRYDQEEPEGGTGILAHLPAIFWQRRWLVVVPFVLLSIAGVAAALLWPTTYRSSAVLVVESQDLPRDIVSSPVTDLIDQRIAKIREQILSRGDLIEVIQQVGLYEDERRTKAMSEIVKNMRESTKVQALNADIGANNSGNYGNKDAVIAFSLSFDYKDPVKAQLVMQNFTDRFLDMNASKIAEQAATAVSFLSAQAADLKKQVAAAEQEITTFKARNGSALAAPGLYQPSNTGSYDAQIAVLQRENMIARQRLEKARPNSLIALAEAQLAAARAIYTETHPDVVFARQRLEEARRLAASNPQGDDASDAAAIIASNNAQIAALTRARSAEASQAASRAQAQAAGPAMLERATQLESRASILRTQYQDVATRLLAAQNAAKMENEDKGERLSVADPPTLPDKPLSINRILIVLAGILGGVFAGLLLALIAEFAIRPIRGAAQVEKILGVPPLGVVPTLNPSKIRSGMLFGLFGRRGLEPSGVA